MKEIVDDITKLTNEWYFLIGKDHHKDKCCHWYIETKWSYGHPPKYSVQHWGYIVGDIEEHWNTYELALGRLKEILTREIEEYIKDRNENDNEESGW